jgi:transposase-like protein
MYARGLSTSDIEALFTDRDGRSLLSRTAVSEITKRLWAEYEAFASRDLSEFPAPYLFVDGITERLHLGQPREAVLAAWGILADGKKALLRLAPGTKEDTASCREFFQDMRRRGPPDPLLVASDGAPGLIRAIEECLPRSIRQRCWRTRCETCKAKACPRESGVPENLWPEFKVRAAAAIRQPRRRWRDCCAIISRRPMKTSCPRQWPVSTTISRRASRICASPLGHRRAIRTTNLLERLFGEARRRTKSLPSRRRGSSRMPLASVPP